MPFVCLSVFNSSLDEFRIAPESLRDEKVMDFFSKGTKDLNMAKVIFSSMKKKYS
jgi:hypothetical protein